MSNCFAIVRMSAVTHPGRDRPWSFEAAFQRVIEVSSSQPKQRLRTMLGNEAVAYWPNQLPLLYGAKAKKPPPSGCSPGVGTKVLGCAAGLVGSELAAVWKMRGR